MDMYMGMIFPVAFNYAPQGTLMCAGQLLSIAQNSALFSLLGTTYGGDGQSTFALPDLRGRMPIAPSTGVGGRIDSSLGSVGGTPNVTAILNGTGTANVALTVANLPAHNHNATFTPGGGGGATVTLNASTDLATTSQPAAGSFLATGKAGGANQPLLYRPDAGAGTVALNPASATIGGSFAGGSVTVDNTGSGTPLQAPVAVSVNGQIPTVPPYLALNFVIVVEGIYPSRP